MPTALMMHRHMNVSCLHNHLLKFLNFNRSFSKTVEGRWNAIGKQV